MSGSNRDNLRRSGDVQTVIGNVWKHIEKKSTLKEPLNYFKPLLNLLKYTAADASKTHQ